MFGRRTKEPIRVLSIDFDYFLLFQKKEVLCFYPDGQRENSNSVTQLIWATNYASAKASGFDMLQNVVINESDAEIARKIIEQQSEPLCMVADSHVHLHDFIIGSEDRFLGRSGGIIVYNVDFHHDTYANTDPKLHCGNWLLKLLDDGIVTEAHWISTPDSLTETLDPRCKQDMALRDLVGMDFDMVFVCRSGSWVHPHLDPFFAEYLAKPLIQNRRGWECRFQQDILLNRYLDPDFQQAVTQILSVMTHPPKNCLQH